MNDLRPELRAFKRRVQSDIDSFYTNIVSRASSLLDAVMLEHGEGSSATRRFRSADDVTAAATVCRKATEAYNRVLQKADEMKNAEAKTLENCVFACIHSEVRILYANSYFDMIGLNAAQEAQQDFYRR
jgi:hypothetical protein